MAMAGPMTSPQLARLADGTVTAPGTQPWRPESTIRHPAQASTPEEFSSALRELRSACGLSYADLERASAGQLARSTISNMLTARSMPNWETARTFIRACHTRLPTGYLSAAGSLEEWRDAWERAVAEPVPRVPPRAPARRSDPYQLGVHRAFPGEDLQDLPAYIPRGAAEESLRLAFSEVRADSNARFIVLQGAPGSGKTHLAYEMMRDVLPDFGMLHPADASELAAPVPPSTIVWLDDLDRYLRGGLTRAALQAVLQGPCPVVVLGTIWSSQFQGYMMIPRPGDPDTGRREREVLALATVIDVKTLLSAEEMDLAVAMAVRDPRIAAALEPGDSGIFQNLAAAPHLIRRWRHAGDAYAKAMISAAVSVSYPGMRDLLTADLLRGLTEIFLSPAERAQAPRDWFEKGLAEATALVPGGIGALTPVSASRAGHVDGYRVAEILLAHMGTRPGPGSGIIYQLEVDESPDFLSIPGRMQASRSGDARDSRLASVPVNARAGLPLPSAFDQIACGLSEAVGMDAGGVVTVRPEMIPGPEVLAEALCYLRDADPEAADSLVDAVDRWEDARLRPGRPAGNHLNLRVQLATALVRWSLGVTSGTTQDDEGAQVIQMCILARDLLETIDVAVGSAYRDCRPARQLAFRLYLGLSRILRRRQHGQGLRTDLGRACELARVFIDSLDRDPAPGLSRALALDIAGLLRAQQADVSAADLSGVEVRHMDVLDGVVWTRETTWPPGIVDQVEEHSDEIGFGVYRLRVGQRFEAPL